MIRKSFKHFLKNSLLIHKFSVNILFLYLKFVYLTSRWKFILPDNLSAAEIDQKQGILFAIWHNRLAFGMHIYKSYKNVLALASSHTDGRLITDIIKKMNYQVIEGSTNRNPTGALKEIIKQISFGNKVVITPDGPRGPRYKINSTITKLGYKYDKPVIPVSCAANKCFQLKSWDKMMIPKPFCSVVVIIGEPLELSGIEKEDNIFLENKLIELSEQAKASLKEY